MQSIHLGIKYFRGFISRCPSYLGQVPLWRHNSSSSEGGHGLKPVSKSWGSQLPPCITSEVPSGKGSREDLCPRAAQSIAQPCWFGCHLTASAGLCSGMGCFWSPSLFPPLKPLFQAPACSNGKPEHPRRGCGMDFTSWWTHIRYMWAHFILWMHLRSVSAQQPKLYWFQTRTLLPLQISMYPLFPPLNHSFASTWIIIPAWSLLSQKPPADNSFKFGFSPREPYKLHAKHCT